jgi:hypothetical protein
VLRPGRSQSLKLRWWSFARESLFRAEAQMARRDAEHSLRQLLEIAGLCPADGGGGDKTSGAKEKRPQCRTDTWTQHHVAIPNAANPQHARA